jgi:dolichyl-phosphate-mannose--protein O-mannosyl transferase
MADRLPGRMADGGKSKVEFTTKDSVNILLITILAFGIRLWLVFHPDGPVFDEVHFGNFTNWYSLSQFYFDIHPPLGKLLMFFFANVSEYDGLLAFAHVRSGRYANISYVQLRITPACFSALCCPFAYLTVRLSGFSEIAATTASLLLIFDTSLATEGRFILSDGILHFFSSLHILVLAYMFSLPRGRRFNVLHVLNGLSLGAACSCKNTAGGLMVFDAYAYFVAFWPLAKISWLDYIFDLGIYGVSLFLLAFAVYCASFSVHFIVLPYGGHGYGYLPQNMKNQLLQNSAGANGIWAKRIRKPGLLYRTLKISWIMHSGNMGIRKFHGSQSRPFNWPLLTGMDVGFWGANGQEVKCHGNVFSYYFALLGVVLVACNFRSPRYLQALLFVVGWAFCYFPLYLIPRTLYLYHYLIPLMIGCMAAGAALDICLPDKWRGVAAFWVCFLTAFGFWLWTPFVYGKYMHDRDVMMWNKNWYEGDAAYKRESEVDKLGTLNATTKR